MNRSLFGAEFSIKERTSKTEKFLSLLFASNGAPNPRTYPTPALSLSLFLSRVLFTHVNVCITTNLSRVVNTLFCDAQAYIVGWLFRSIEKKIIANGRTKTSEGGLQPFLLFERSDYVCSVVGFALHIDRGNMILLLLRTLFSIFHSELFSQLSSYLEQNNLTSFSILYLECLEMFSHQNQFCHLGEIYSFRRNGFTTVFPFLCECSLTFHQTTCACQF